MSGRLNLFFSTLFLCAFVIVTIKYGSTHSCFEAFVPIWDVGTSLGQLETSRSSWPFLQVS